MARRSSRATVAFAVAGSLLVMSGCLLLTSIDDLGPGARPVAVDAPEDVVDAEADGRRVDASSSDGSVVLGAPYLVARTTPGLRGLGVDSSRVFFTNEDSGELRSASKAGAADGGSTLFAASIKPGDLAVGSTRVYWAFNLSGNPSSADNVYLSARNDGNDLQHVGSYATSARLSLAAGHVYTSTFDASSTWSVLRDGVLLEPRGGPPSRCIVSDGATAFYEQGGMIKSSPVPDAGAFASALATDLAVDATTLYWITSTGEVQKLDKDKPGQPPTTLARGLSGLARIALDGDAVYVTAWGLGASTGRVVRLPKVGGPSTDVATGLSEPWGLAVDGSGVYVANHGDGTVIGVPRL